MKSSRTHKSRHLGSLLALVTLVSFLPFLTQATAAPPQSPPNPEELVVNQQDDGRHFELSEGQILVLRLEGNPSTGYMWVVEEPDQLKLQQVGPSQFESESDLLGAPGTMTQRFRAVEAGTSVLNMAYRRPWEDTAPLETFSIAVEGVGAFAKDALPSPAASYAPVPQPKAARPAPADDQPDQTPSSYNWCDLGGCTPIRNQLSCGACWAFATVGVLELQIKRSDGVTRDLSEQYLVSCNAEGWNCDDGGWWAHDYHQWNIPPGELGAGAVYEADFPYVASDVACNPPHAHHEKITSWDYVDPYSNSSLPPAADIKQAIYDHGPLAVGICVGPVFQGYNGGVFEIDESYVCGGGLNHGVVLVGWDDNQGSNGVWYLRNSWGTVWGESGYMRIGYGTSRVGSGATYISYPGGANDPPTAPSALQASAASKTQINLAWTDNSGDETGFRIERSPNGSSSWATIATVGANVTSYPNTNLPEDTSFYYRVYAYNGNGDSDYTNVALAKTFGDLVPTLYLPIIVRSHQTYGDFGLPIDSGFEAGQVPPSGWSRIQSNPRQTWKIRQSTTAYEGSYFADCEFDDGLALQNEVLLSPQFEASSAQLQFHSMGSPYWCRDTFDNCDLNVWLVVGDWGGPDDIQVYTADNAWITDYTWASSTVNLTPFLPAGTPVRVGFQYEGIDGAQIGLDAIHIRP